MVEDYLAKIRPGDEEWTALFADGLRDVMTPSDEKPKSEQETQK